MNIKDTENAFKEHFKFPLKGNLDIVKELNNPGGVQRPNIYCQVLNCVRENVHKGVAVQYQHVDRRRYSYTEMKHKMA